jgi:hypothetical protein
MEGERKRMKKLIPRLAPKTLSLLSVLLSLRFSNFPTTISSCRLDNGDKPRGLCEIDQAANMLNSGLSFML